MEALFAWLPFKLQATIQKLVVALFAEGLFFYGLFTEQAGLCIFALIVLAFFIVIAYAAGPQADR